MGSVAEILSEHDRNLDWFNANYKELKKKYLDRWVAVKNSQVVDYDRSYLTLAKRAKRKYKGDFSKLALGYVSEKPIELIL